MENRKHLEWNEKYSVGVLEIDNQHKIMFAILNGLVDLVGTTPTKEKIRGVIGQLLEYKKFHFKTEEEYFKQFNYERTEEHIAAHNTFNLKLEEFQAHDGEDALALAFDVIDYLEDWFVEHLLTADQGYVECFKAHGLK
jgi:hemerythrin